MCIKRRTQIVTASCEVEPTVALTNCPTCGDFRLPAAALVIRKCADSYRHSVRFTCIRCHKRRSKTINERQAYLLMIRGVQMQTWRVPADAPSTLVLQDVTIDQLLDLHLLAERAGWKIDLPIEVLPPIAVQEAESVAC